KALIHYGTINLVPCFKVITGVCTSPNQVACVCVACVRPARVCVCVCVCVSVGDHVLCPLLDLELDVELPLQRSDALLMRRHATLRPRVLWGVLCRGHSSEVKGQDSWSEFQVS